MDYSVFYYAYSTMAQTLAGAFGFLGAVVLFRMQAITSLMMELVRRRGDFARTPVDQSLRRMESQGQWAEIIKSFEAGRAASERTAEFVDGNELGEYDEIITDLKLMLARLDALKKGLGRSLILTTGTIVGCFVLIPLTHKSTFLSDSDACWTVLIVVVLVAVGTLCSYTPLVADLVDLKFEDQ